MIGSYAEILVDPAAHANRAVDEVFSFLRAESPVTYCETSDYPPFWSVVRHADVRDAYMRPGVYGSTKGVLLRSQDLGVDPGGDLTLALSDPPRHGLIRQIIAPCFDERAARKLSEVMRQDTENVLCAASESDVVDFSHDVAECLSSRLIAHLLGVPEADLNQVCRWIAEGFTSKRPMTSHPQLANYFIEAIYQRMEAPRADSVGLLVEGEVCGQMLSETEILLNIENLLGASENAGLSLAAGILGLLSHAPGRTQLSGDRRLIASACEEMLRWASSATHSMRVARRETTLGGARIAAGDRVVLWVRSANRDEIVFDMPDEFRIDRAPNRHLALGVGEHVCIGQIMARHQMRILLETLASRVRSFELAGDVRQIASIAVSGPSYMPVRIRMR